MPEPEASHGAELPSGAVMTAVMRAVQAYEPGAALAIIDSPGALLSVMLETARRVLAAAAPAITAAEHQRLSEGTQAAIKRVEQLAQAAQGLAVTKAVAAERERIRQLVHRHLTEVCATRGNASAAAAAIRRIHADLIGDPQ